MRRCINRQREQPAKSEKTSIAESFVTALKSPLMYWITLQMMMSGFQRITDAMPRVASTLHAWSWIVSALLTPLLNSIKREIEGRKVKLPRLQSERIGILRD